jgi:hypothetical protein
VHHLALDEYAAADYGINGAQHCQELGGVRELVRVGDLLDEDVLLKDLAPSGPGLFFCLHIKGEREMVMQGQGIIVFWGIKKNQHMERRKRLH